MTEGRQRDASSAARRRRALRIPDDEIVRPTDASDGVPTPEGPSIEQSVLTPTRIITINPEPGTELQPIPEAYVPAPPPPPPETLPDRLMGTGTTSSEIQPAPIYPAS